MSHAPDAGHPVAITAAQVEALEMLQQSHPAPHFIPSPATAVALLNRGWVEKATIGANIHTRSLYYITNAGSLALRIGKRRQPQPQGGNHAQG